MSMNLPMQSKNLPIIAEIEHAIRKLPGSKEEQTKLRTAISKDLNKFKVMADKSKQLVIIKKEELLSKKLEIISSDDYELLPRNPIEEIKSNLTKLIKKYKNEIPANQVKNILDFNNVREPKLNNMEKSTYSIQNTEELINGLLKEYYRQKKGIAMGSVIGPKLADNYMNKIDERISSLTGIKYYARYVDDIIIVYDSQIVSSKHIEEYANRLHKNLKFTSEDEQQNKMNFLDVTIKREETSVSFSKYEKLCNNGKTINFKSYCPLENKKNVFNMELRKILNRTTQQENIDIEVKQLFKKFQLNDYPKHILFASQKNKMSNIISIINSENSPRDQFKIAGVVYRMSCTCGSPNYYIGETGRRLELRVKEHEAAIRLRRTESAWFLHCRKFNCNINIKNTKILYRIENNLERKIVEHFCIAEHVNLLNLNAGMIVDACWERLLGIKRNQRITS
ncbi:uncharacterized protein LOC111641948 [Centruroides sculpturatus]|uniref:uncharacterized protein LOC111641948 n=2 Tax=Centruroides sculpturatus TaxID=218467 RepID=UPI000C6D4449|nr:uncharacterized protein LOC111635018 isoform X3 [Centruroides sculpturatus]XP_023243970.1 uncharacterized protein LOC111641948 [Centruroides sculpturatus]